MINSHQHPMATGFGNVRMNTQNVLMALVGAAILAGGACSEPPDPRRTNFEIRSKDTIAKYDPKTGRLQRIDGDTNKNGKIESFSYWDATRLIRVEIDRDEDDKIDRWEHYDEQKKLIRVGTSSRDDAIEDTWAYPDQSGFLARVETDSDRDGLIDKREQFAPKPGSPTDRVLTSVELEFDKAGKPGRRLYYRADGSFEKSEVLR